MATELIGIELELRGEEGVFRDLQKLDSMLQGFSGAKGKKTIELDLGKSQQRLIELRGEINQTVRDIDKLKKKKNELYSERQGFEKESDEYKELSKDIDRVSAALDEAQDHLKTTKGEFKDVTVRVNELRYALKNFSQMSFGKMFKEISTGLKHAGQNMQTLGNTLTRIGSPFQRFTSGLLMGAGYKALNLATEGLENAFSRYDTMRKYPLMMKQMGFIDDASQAADSVARLTEAVDGLPTSLDEIVSMSQRFSLALGNMTKGEDLAIAANNAFLASMATETEQYQGMMQLSDLAAGKMLNEREWNSLITSMEVGIHAVGEGFGYTSENMDEFLQLLRGGDIPVDQFLDKLIEVGASQDSILGQAAGISKQSFEALARNTRTAFSRLGADALKALDEVFKQYNGKDLIGNLLDAKGVIDQWSQSLQSWIKAHPDEIIGFFQKLKEIDFAGFARGMLDGYKTIANAIEWFAGAAGGKGLQKIGWFMTIAGPLGRIVTTFGGALKGLSHPLALIFAAIAKGTMMGVGEMKKKGLIGTLGELFGGAGGAGKAAKQAAEAGKAAESAGEALPKMGKFSLGVSNLFKGWAEVATMVGGTALVGWGTFKAFKSMFKDLKEIADISSEINWGVASADLVAMGGFITAFIAVGTKVGQGLGLKGLAGGGIFAGLTAIFAGTFWADMAMIKRGFKAIKDATEYIQETNDNLNQLTTVSGVGGVKAKVKNAITLFNQITDLLQISRNNPITGESTSGLKELDKKSASTIKYVANSIKSMKTAIESINEISQIRVNIGGLTAVIPQFRVALTKIGNMLGELPPGMGSSETASNMTNMSTIMTDLKASLQSMIGTDGVLAMIPELVGKVNRMVHGGQLEGMIGAMNKLGGSLKEVMNSLNFGGFDTGTMMSDLSNISSSLDQVNAIIEKINGLGKVEVNTEGTANIGMVIDNLKTAFSQDKVGELVGTVTAFVATVQAALQTIEQLNQEVEVDVTFKLSQGFYDSKKKVIDEIKKGKKQIQSQKGSISLSIPVRVWFNVVTNAASALAKITKERWAVQRGATGQAGPITVGQGQSMGGLRTRSGVLYRSGGGSIFKPRGVDRIPAMLAEGEYVHKKQAVDFFGIDFMRKVNNMDVRGAMESLLTRAGTSVGIGRQSVVNNTVNNNQRITQNINTNNPNFAKVRMGRFVGAL